MPTKTRQMIIFALAIMAILVAVYGVVRLQAKVTDVPVRQDQEIR